MHVEMIVKFWPSELVIIIIIKEEKSLKRESTIICFFCWVQDTIISYSWQTSIKNRFVNKVYLITSR